MPSINSVRRRIPRFSGRCSVTSGSYATARTYVEKGYRAVKFGWGVFGQDAGRDRELVAAARDALGPDRALLVDPGWYPAGWTGPMRRRREALALCQWLADYCVGWVEDFIHPENFAEYAYVRERSPVPMAAGEQVATSWDFERFIGGLRGRGPAGSLPLRRPRSPGRWLGWPTWCRIPGSPIC